MQKKTPKEFSPVGSRYKQIINYEPKIRRSSHPSLITLQNVTRANIMKNSEKASANSELNSKTLYEVKFTMQR